MKNTLVNFSPQLTHLQFNKGSDTDRYFILEREYISFNNDYDLFDILVGVRT